MSDSITLMTIGGITLDNARSVALMAVGSVAVVTAITLTKNPKEVIKEFQQLFSKKTAKITGRDAQ